MTHDLPVPRQDDRSDGTTVVEWGTEAESPRIGRFRQAFAGLGHDHRVPVLLAGLGAAAALASLLGEWSTITIPNGGPDPATPLEVTSGVSDSGGLGSAYLVGLLALGGTVALALRGTTAVRANARVTGLALAAGVLALLAATVSTLDDTVRRAFVYSNDPGFVVEHGRGLLVAFAAVLLFAAALVRAAPEPTGARAAPADLPAQPDGAPADPVGRRRRAGRRSGEEAEPDERRPPADITVAPTVPFAREAPPD
ncbi:hypothetical protein KIF24_29200 [Micromonospora sp. Llam7]|uniref:hypothetical protein n=1 Tax=Micromonospora tarapacensis TaxID=2835305 RepID=UPI001C83FCE0|nr:hypothetical protein [Micromonospora tarapacensis]MBX7269688.1 hypothetical protein [Micromonospora tarapacensis]